MLTVGIYSSGYSEIHSMNMKIYPAFAWHKVHLPSVILLNSFLIFLFSLVIYYVCVYFLVYIVLVLCCLSYSKNFLKK